MKNLIFKILGETLIFTIVYYITNFFPGPHFHSSLHHQRDLDKISLFDAFYYPLITQTTVGYGDLTARSTLAKTLTCLQLIWLLYIASDIVI